MMSRDINKLGGIASIGADLGSQRRKPLVSKSKNNLRPGGAGLRDMDERASTRSVRTRQSFRQLHLGFGRRKINAVIDLRQRQFDAN
jgi:hypothetical protein